MNVVCVCVCVTDFVTDHKLVKHKSECIERENYGNEKYR